MIFLWDVVICWLIGHDKEYPSTHRWECKRCGINAEYYDRKYRE